MKSILIMDNESYIRELLSTYIGKYTNYKTITAESGKAALDIIKTTKPDLIIIDLLLPKIGGISLFYEFQKFEKTKGTPVIFMSGTIMDKEFQQEGIELGAVDYITKPVNLESLVNKIKSVLEENSKNTDSI